MVAIMGIWSEEVVGPGCSLQLWKVWLLVISMSGDGVLLCRVKIGNCGSMCLQRSWFMRVVRLRPTGLLSACPSEECLEFKSPNKCRVLSIMLDCQCSAGRESWVVCNQSLL